MRAELLVVALPRRRVKDAARAHAVGGRDVEEANALVPPEGRSQGGRGQVALGGPRLNLDDRLGARLPSDARERRPRTRQLRLGVARLERP